MDMGYLPPTLCMMELANRVDKNATARVAQYGISWANRMSSIADGGDNEESTSPLIQGYTPAVFCADVDGHGQEFCCPGIDDNWYSGGFPGSPRDAYRPWTYPTHAGDMPILIITKESLILP